MCRLGLLGSIALFLCAGCETKSDNVWPDKPGPKVLTSFGPIQCFAMNVAGDDAVVQVVWTAEGAHHHGDPSTQALKLAHKADLLFYVGLTLGDGDLAGKLKTRSGNGNLKVVALGDSIDKKVLLQGECHHEGGHEPGENHDHTDPHVWLSPEHAKTMVLAIRDELKRVDPAHASGYDARAAAYVAKLERLQQDGLAMLKNVKDRKILSHHDALAYFAKSFNLEIVDFIQIGEVEPGSAQLDQIVKQCEKTGVRVIAVEPQFNSKTAASVIAAALKVKPAFAEVDTLETASQEDLTLDYYERKMRTNLENLAKALQ
jgi:zinc transport system substrate-binding protein